MFTVINFEVRKTIYISHEMFRTRLAIKNCKRNDYHGRGQPSIVYLNFEPSEVFEFCLTGFGWAFVKPNEIGSAESLKKPNTCRQTCLTVGKRFLRWIRLNNKIARILALETNGGPRKRPEPEIEEGPRGAKARKCQV